MESENDTVTIKVRDRTATVIRALSKATQISQLDLMTAIFGEVDRALQDLYEGRRILFMSDYDLKNKMVHLRFSNSFYASDSEIPKALLNEIHEAFEGKQEPEKPEHKTYCQQIQEQHDEELKQQKESEDA